MNDDPPWPEPEPATPGWRFVHIGLQDEPVDIGGHDAWSVGWESEGRTIVVGHPSYPWQRHEMSVYRVAGAAPPVRFAAGEVSNNVWTFWAPEDDAEAP